MFNISDGLKIPESQFVNYIAEKMGQGGVKSKLKCGTFGCAYVTKTNKVIKFTSDVGEAELVNKLVGTKTNHLINVYAVNDINVKNFYKGNYVKTGNTFDNTIKNDFVVHNERKFSRLIVIIRDMVRTLTTKQKEYYNVLMVMFLDRLTSTNDFIDMIKKTNYYTRTMDDQFLDFWMKLSKQRDGVIKEFRDNEINTMEANDLNVGFKRDGTFVYFDPWGVGKELSGNIIERLGQVN